MQIDRQDVKWVAGLIAAVCTALIGQAEVIPEPYRHYVTIAGLVATVISGYAITPAGSVKQ